MQSLVSVLMAAYNAEKYIKDAIESILNQTYKNFELIIVDDGATDRTAGIVKSFKDNHIICTENLANMGISQSKNTDIRNARGLLGFLTDADYVWASI